LKGVKGNRALEVPGFRRNNNSIKMDLT